MFGLFYQTELKIYELHMWFDTKEEANKQKEKLEQYQRMCHPGHPVVIKIKQLDSREVSNEIRDLETEIVDKTNEIILRQTKMKYEEMVINALTVEVDKSKEDLRKKVKYEE